MQECVLYTINYGKTFKLSDIDSVLYSDERPVEIRFKQSFVNLKRKGLNVWKITAVFYQGLLLIIIETDRIGIP